jgi:hypothetical protein
MTNHNFQQKSLSASAISLKRAVNEQLAFVSLGIKCQGFEFELSSIGNACSKLF